MTNRFVGVALVAITAFVASVGCGEGSTTIIVIPTGATGTGGSEAQSSANSGAGGTEVCSVDEKVCGGECVWLDATFTGCAAESCEPCAKAHAVPVCDGKTCVIGTCVGRWHDCNESDEDGCESDGVTDPLNCGACGVVCVTGHACTKGACI